MGICSVEGIDVYLNSGRFCVSVGYDVWVYVCRVWDIDMKVEYKVLLVICNTRLTIQQCKKVLNLVRRSWITLKKRQNIFKSGRLSLRYFEYRESFESEHRKSTSVLYLCCACTSKWAWEGFWQVAAVPRVIRAAKMVGCSRVIAQVWGSMHRIDAT